MEEKSEPQNPITETRYYFVDRIKIGLQIQNIKMTKELNTQIESYLMVSYDNVKKELGEELDEFIKRCSLALFVYFDKEVELEQDPYKRLEIQKEILNVFQKVLLINQVLVKSFDEVLSDSDLKKFHMGFQPVYVHVAIQWYRDFRKVSGTASNKGCLLLILCTFLFLAFSGMAIARLLR